MSSTINEPTDVEIKTSYVININSLRTKMVIENETPDLETRVRRNLFDANIGNIKIKKIIFNDPGVVEVTYDTINRQTLDTVRYLTTGNRPEATITLSAEMRSTEGTKYFGGLTIKPNKRIRYKDSKLTVEYHVVSKLLLAVN